MPTTAPDNRLRVWLIVLAGLAALVFLIVDFQGDRDDPAVGTASQQASPSEDRRADPEAPPASPGSEPGSVAEAADLAPTDEAGAPILGDSADWGPGSGAQGEPGSRPPGRQGLASGSGGNGEPTAQEIEKAIERARAIQALEAGRLAARNTTARPAAIQQGLNVPTFVPPEVQEAAEGPRDAPPEILAAMRERYETPPEIARSMTEAASSGTSDAMRAYMAGETDQRPAQ